MNSVGRNGRGGQGGSSLGDGPLSGEEGFVAADDGFHVAVAHALGGVAGEGGAEAAAAVHEDFGILIGVEAFEIAFEDAFAQVDGFGGVAGGPFVVFADVQEDGSGVGGKAAAGFGYANFLNATFGLVHQGKKAGGMVHGGRVRGAVGRASFSFRSESWWVELHRMSMLNVLRLVLAGGGAAGALVAEPAVEYEASRVVPPAPPREFRGVWVATVVNIDWPSKPGLPAGQQQQELLAILDRCVALRLNAVILQVRPQCDALYASSFEPWSEYLSGTMGLPPVPFYDPLEFAVREAHRRGLELHAWFNPYRAHHFGSKSPIAARHVSRRQPELAKRYGRYLWLDPGEPEVQAHSRKVILDVVKRYDIDGVHMDDYFYPYPERDEAGKVVPFPDEPSWQKRGKASGLSRDDWRRRNVDEFIETLQREIRAIKPRVRFGLSPFGIWRPQHPEAIRGFDQYGLLYADARKWLLEGWVDYFTPQLYWPIQPPEQSYTNLLAWWAGQNPKGRHLWPGNYTGRVGDPWKAEELIEQIRATRRQAGAGGNVHFSMKPLLQNKGGVADALVKEVYQAPALVPASAWLDAVPPGRPRLRVSEAEGRAKATWSSPGEETVWQWVVQTRTGGAWSLEILPGGRTEREMGAEAGAGPEVVAVSAVDRCGNLGSPAVVERSVVRR